MDRLLILSCSQRKAPATGRVPAIDRYDGPVFRVLRNYLREGSPEALTVLIVSAKYGLIESNRRIPVYEHRMSAARAKELRPQVLAAAPRLLASRCWQEVGVCAGKYYRSALDGFLPLLPHGSQVVFIGGGQGPRLTRLHAWLRRSALVDGQEGGE
ncbi:MAG TPA: hypothetical protein VMG10_14885 [Gemmataceae bacterium]|nr:hypothetical protein [Gemmataceae bacterium]